MIISRFQISQVIPPGMDFSNVVVQEDTPEVDGELTSLIGGTDGSSPKAIPAIWSDVSASPAILIVQRHQFNCYCLIAISFGRLCGSSQIPTNQ